MKNNTISFLGESKPYMSQITTECQQSINTKLSMHTLKTIIINELACQIIRNMLLFNFSARNRKYTLKKIRVINLTYHNRQRGAIHDDWENSSSKATEYLPGFAFKNDKGHQGHATKSGEHKREEANEFSLLPLRCIDDEGQDINYLNCCTSSVDRWHQNVVLGHKRHPVPATKYNINN